MSLVETEILSVADAQTELNTLNAAITAYYTGSQVRSLEVGSVNFHRRYQFNTSQQLFEFMIARAAYLRRYIAERSATTTVVPVFNQNRNIPMYFEKGR